MLLAGAKGHAKELLEILSANGESDLVCFDDVNTDIPVTLFNLFRILTNLEAATDYFTGSDKRFVLATGGTTVRQKLEQKISGIGGIVHSVISGHALISQYDVQLGIGVNIMQRVIIQPSVTIGRGTLVNAGSIIHHDSTVGDYCEICPSVTVTGRCSIGDFSFIGTGAVIKPDVRIGNHVIVGAGSVVNKDVPDGCKVAGVPARVLNKNF